MLSIATLTQSAAARLYRLGNNQGLGYAPYMDEAGDDTRAEAVRCAIADGYSHEIFAYNTSEVDVLVDADGGIIAIGGESNGHGAYCVVLSDVSDND